METLELSRAELWFCAPDTPAIGEARVFELRIGNDVRRVRARTVLASRAPYLASQPIYELFVQEETEQGRSAILRRDTPSILSLKEQFDESIWRYQISKMLPGRTSRVWRPETDERFCVALHSTGAGDILGINEKGRLFETPFNWRENRFKKFVWWPQDKFEAHFAKLFEGNSLLRHAYDWHGWNREQRTAHLLWCKNGTWDELRSLAQCALIVNYPHNDDTATYEHWDLFDLGLLNAEPDLAANILGSWTDIFLRVFQPNCARKNAPSYETGQLNSLWDSMPKLPQFQPSAHQKLEAHLLLRDWLRANAPDDEERLMGLFPPLSA